MSEPKDVWFGKGDMDYVHVREVKGPRLRTAFIRLVPEHTGPIETFDVEASVDLDEHGAIIGVNIVWEQP